MFQVARATRRERLIHISNLLAAKERANPGAREVIEFELWRLETAILPVPTTPAAEVAS